MAYACIDPNWGEPLVMAETIHSSPEGAEGLAIMSQSCSLYSGAQLNRTPPIPGRWEGLEKQGYTIKKIVALVETDGTLNRTPFATQ